MKRSSLVFFKILLHVFLPLLVGFFIYVFYRPNVWISKQFNINSISYAEISNYSLLKRWFIFSVPDLCWSYSFASLIFILNHLIKFSSHTIVFIVVLIIVAASELI